MNTPFNKTPAHQKIAEHNEDIRTLKRLLDLVDDPSPLLDAHKLAREEAALTDEQQDNLNEALETLERAAELRKGIIDDRSALTGDQEQHTSDVESFKAWRDEETERLRVQKETQDGVEVTQERERLRLEAEWKDMEQKFSDAMTPIDDMKAQAEKNVTETEKELLKQKRITARLEKKAKRVKDTLAADDEDDEDK